MKKLLVVLVMMIQCLVTWSAPALGAQTAKVMVNGQRLASVATPVSKNYSLLVPLRTVGEAIGADVDFDSVNKRITINRNNQQVILYLGKKVGFANGGQQFQLGVAPQTINGTTMVPLRFVSEQLGAGITWDEGKQIAHIEVDKGKHQVSAKEYLSTVLAATKNSGTFKFKGQSQMALSAPTQPGSPAGTIELKYQVAGQWAAGDVYFSERNFLPSSGQYGDAIEFLQQGQALRIKVPGGRFEAAGDAEDIAMRQLKQHGALVLKNLQQYGSIVNYGNNNEGYEVLWVKLDEDLVKQNLLGLSPGTSAYAKARAVIGYRLVVDSNTNLIEEVSYSAHVVTPIGAKVVIYSGEGSTTFSGFGENKDFPQV